MFLIAPFFSLTSSAEGGGATPGNFRYFPQDDEHRHHLNDRGHHYYNAKAIITERTITFTAQSEGVRAAPFVRSSNPHSLSLCSVFTSLPLATSTYHFHLHSKRSSETLNTFGNGLKFRCRSIAFENKYAHTLVFNISSIV